MLERSEQSNTNRGVPDSGGRVAADRHSDLRRSCGLLEVKLAIMERALYLILVELELDGAARATDEQRARLAFAVSNAWSALRDEVRASVPVESV